MWVWIHVARLFLWESEGLWIFIFFVNTGRRFKFRVKCGTRRDVMVLEITIQRVQAN